MKIWHDFVFEAAHHLPGTPPEHRCHRLHGHTFNVRLVYEGEPDHTTGFILDFAVIESAWLAIAAEELDHHLLNDVAGLPNPTCEQIAEWIFNRMGIAVGNLVSVEVCENQRTGAAYP